MRSKNVQKLIAAGALLVSAGGLQAQSADALIDKLVEKGILTVKEANDLREEADKGFTQAYAVKSGMPDWVNSMRLNGDLRLRYDGIYGDMAGLRDRNRLRYRLRFGATATLNDNFEVGFRFMSGENGTGGFTSTDPISGNSSFQDNASKKLIGIDLAYARWAAFNRANWGLTFTAGKMENPVVFSDIVFDPDYTPEGLAEQFTFTLNPKHAVKFTLGQFVLDELSASSRDPYLLGAQLRLDSVWNLHWQTTLGVSALAISGKDGLLSANVPDQNRGNTRNAAGMLQNNFNPIIVDGAVTYSLDKFHYYSGAFPIRVGGTYLYNPGADDDNRAYEIGIMFGKSGKRGTWDLSYRWKTIEPDAWYEEVVDSDNGAFYPAAPVGGRAGYGAGSNLRGHVVRAAYSPFDALTLSATFYLLELINETPSGAETETGRLQIDAAWKF